MIFVCPSPPCGTVSTELLIKSELGGGEEVGEEERHFVVITVLIPMIISNL
jgi:hypothetical protein